MRAMKEWPVRLTQQQQLILGNELKFDPVTIIMGETIEINIKASAREPQLIIKIRELILIPTSLCQLALKLFKNREENKSRQTCASFGGNTSDFKRYSKKCKAELGGNRKLTKNDPL